MNPGETQIKILSLFCRAMPQAREPVDRHGNRSTIRQINT